MKKLIAALLIISLFSCEEDTKMVTEEGYEILVIDGCEYIKKYNGYRMGYSFSHKGNCKYCIERNKQK